MTTLATEPIVELRPPRRRRITKIVLWLVGLALFWLLLHLLGVDVRGWLDHLWDQIKEIPPGYLIARVALQTGADLLRRPLLLRDPPRRVPGRGVALWPDRRRLRGRRRDERLPAREHRHLRDPAHVRRRSSRAARSPARSRPTSCRRSSSRSRGRSSTSTCSSASPARSTSASAGRRHTRRDDPIFSRRRSSSSSSSAGSSGGR